VAARSNVEKVNPIWATVIIQFRPVFGSLPPVRAQSGAGSERRPFAGRGCQGDNRSILQLPDSTR
jgi:hypothetical protein